MVTGSVALNTYALPRSTFDIDIVIEMPFQKIEDFLQLFSGNFYINEQTAKAELYHKGIGMFNVIDHSSGYKVDFIIKQHTPYELVKFHNRKTIIFEQVPVSICSPEDLVISKLQWIQELQSERQMNDIKSLLLYPDLNRAYIVHWIQELQLQTFGLI